MKGCDDGLIVQKNMVKINGEFKLLSVLSIRIERTQLFGITLYYLQDETLLNLVVTLVWMVYPVAYA